MNLSTTVARHDKPHHFRLHQTSIGLVIYSILNPDKEKIYYGFQRDFNSVSLFRLSLDGEPQIKVSIKTRGNVTFDLPKPDTRFNREIIKYIKNLESGVAKCQ